MITISDVFEARRAISKDIRKTDLIHASKLKCDNDIYLKTENLQITGSFKIRGATNKISKLGSEQRSAGVIACSAGNHSQGVALAASKYGVKSTLFMPATAPISKIEATKSYGAEVVLVKGVYDDAYNAAIEFQKKNGGTFIHPFDDDLIIAGQATVGLEILEQLEDVDAVVTSIGGGGMIAGIATVIKSLKPNVKMYGVQVDGALSMHDALKNKKRAGLEAVSTFADGIAVKMPGERTYEICQNCLDEVISVTDDEVARAVLTLIEKQKLVSEGAGATAVAAVLENKLPIKGKKVVAVISGGNIDVNILSRVINRALITSGRLAELTVKLIDRPGNLSKIISAIANSQANIVTLNQVADFENIARNNCILHITLETRNFEHIEEIKEMLNRISDIEVI